MTGPPAAEDLLLGIDIGTTATKVVLVDGAGRESGGRSAPTPFVTTGERVEMEVNALLDCVHALLGGLGEARHHVVGVGLAGMAESGAPLDDARRPLAPVIAWLDGRGEEAVARLEEHFGPDLALCVGQPVRTVMTVAKLGWLVEHGLQGGQRWLGVPELVLHRLTGAEAIEFSQAARTGCYDVASRTWIPEVPEVLGFSLDLFAPVERAGSVIGRTSSRGAAWAGLREGIPVTVAGHDHLAGMAGAGVDAGEAVNSVGTAETLVARSPTLPDIRRALEVGAAVTIYPGGHEWAVLVSAARAGVVLDRAATLLDHSPSELDQLASQSAPADIGDAVDVLAHDPGRAGRVLASGPPGAMWAGLLHVLAERTSDGARRLAELTGAPRRIVAFGGGSVSSPWLRAKAAALPWPLWRSTATWAVARGAALHAGVAAGWWPSTDDAPRPEAVRID